MCVRREREREFRKRPKSGRSSVNKLQSIYNTALNLKYLYYSYLPLSPWPCESGEFIEHYYLCIVTLAQQVDVRRTRLPAMDGRKRARRGKPDILFKSQHLKASTSSPIQCVLIP